jgi:hypothetical protein
VDDRRGGGPPRVEAEAEADDRLGGGPPRRRVRPPTESTSCAVDLRCRRGLPPAAPTGAAAQCRPASRRSTGWGRGREAAPVRRRRKRAAATCWWGRWRTAAGGVEAEADNRRVEPEAGGRGLRRRRATASASDGEDGTVGLREGERNMEISQECGSGGAARILQLPLRQLLEAAQWVPHPHFALVGRDGEVAGVGLTKPDKSSYGASSNKQRNAVGTTIHPAPRPHPTL